MPDTEKAALYETCFVKNFIRKPFQERSLFELRSQNKRQRFFFSYMSWIQYLSCGKLHAGDRHGQD